MPCSPPGIGARAPAAEFHCLAVEDSRHARFEADGERGRLVGRPVPGALGQHICWSRRFLPGVGQVRHIQAHAPQIAIDLDALDDRLIDRILRLRANFSLSRDSRRFQSRTGARTSAWDPACDRGLHADLVVAFCWQRCGPTISRLLARQPNQLLGDDVPAQGGAEISSWFDKWRWRAARAGRNRTQEHLAAIEHLGRDARAEIKGQLADRLQVYLLAEIDRQLMTS